jgi:hypothetical protein
MAMGMGMFRCQIALPIVNSPKPTVTRSKMARCLRQVGIGSGVRCGHTTSRTWVVRTTDRKPSGVFGNCSDACALRVSSKVVFLTFMQDNDKRSFILDRTSMTRWSILNVD